jgi:hypothetical protein
MKGATSLPEDQMRLYLLNFVKKKGLDPLLAETWYNLNEAEVAKDKVNTIFSFSFMGR